MISVDSAVTRIVILNLRTAITSFLKALFQQGFRICFQSHFFFVFKKPVHLLGLGEFVFSIPAIPALLPRVDIGIWAGSQTFLPHRFAQFLILDEFARAFHRGEQSRF